MIAYKPFLHQRSSAHNTHMNAEVAVRKISKVSLDKNSFQELSNELFILKQLRHENVVIFVIDLGLFVVSLNIFSLQTL